MDEKEFDYLNVIPLVDVMLVLLTIVLTTSTFIAGGAIQVELPKTAAGHHTATPRSRTVTIDKDGYLWLDKQAVTLDSLALALAAVNRTTPVVVRADRNIPLQMFVDVYEMVKKLGFDTLSLHTEQSI